MKVMDENAVLGKAQEPPFQAVSGFAEAEHAAPKSLPFGRQWLYALGQLGWSTLTGLISFQLVYFYLPPKHEDTEQHVFPVHVTQEPFLVVLNVIAILATAGRLWDAITDPLIASWSDRLDHRWGRRIPFLAASGLPAAVCCWFLFFPVVKKESTWNIVWLAVMQALFYFFLTAYVTPYFSLVAELGHTAEERLNLSTWISITFALGTILASGTPAIGSAFGLDAVGNFQAGVGVVCTISLVLMYVPVLTIDEKLYCSSQPSQLSIREALRHCLGNPYFRPYVAADFSYFFGMAIISTGMPYFLTVLLQLDNNLLVIVFGTIAALSFLLYYPTNLIARCFGKKRPVLFALAVLNLVYGMIFFLGWLPLPALVQVFALGGLASVPIAILGILPNAILSDIASHDSRRTGHKQEGMYFAARALLNKLGQSIAILIFAGLTNFGKDVGDDMGIRLSGPVGLAFGLMAFISFLYYNEEEVSRESAAPGIADSISALRLATQQDQDVCKEAPFPDAPSMVTGKHYGVLKLSS
mmetsp:Transcript_32717/g.57949  ORF Transcript_32717/g.57949 Transcript_32717/m.57949 type:complete len:527 (-) Transcript_32717:21-1601(-)